MTQRNTEWSEDEKQRAQLVLEHDARSGISDDTRAAPTTKCREWRDTLHTEDLDSIIPIADEEPEFSRSTVREHVSGRCSHLTTVVGIAFEYDKSKKTWTRRDSE